MHEALAEGEQDYRKCDTASTSEALAGRRVLD